MSRDEFTRVMAFLSATTGKQVPEDMAEGYFALLGDLPLEALQVAAQRALLESSYPVLPPVGVLRKLAVEAMNASDREPTADEAWGTVLRAISRFGLMREPEALESLPDGPVRRAAECLGWRSLCDSTEPEISRAQYRKAFEGLQGRDDRQRLLPPALRDALDHVAAAMPELAGPDRRNSWEVIQDEATRRRLAAPESSEPGR
jgi:hypothetical protein